MSADLYPHRLYWDGARGCAKWDGQGVELAAAPQIPGLPHITEIDYAPGIVAELRERCDRRREMESHEIKAARAWLEAGNWRT